MNHIITSILGWITGNAVTLAAITGASAIAFAAAWAASRQIRKVFDRWGAADTLTVLVAGFASAYAALGSNKYLRVAMGYGLDLRLALLVVFEGATVVSAIRARKNIRDVGASGVDGAAMWALTVLSGALAASVSGSVREAAGRLIVPCLACWMWERAMTPERRVQRARRAPSVIRWRITRERVAVWLRIADATDTDVSAVDAGRRIGRFLKVTDREINGRRWPLTVKARADRERLSLMRDALVRFGNPDEVYRLLRDSGYSQALQRLGITGPSGPGSPDQADRTATGSTVPSRPGGQADRGPDRTADAGPDHPRRTSAGPDRADRTTRTGPAHTPDRTGGPDRPASLEDLEEACRTWAAAQNVDPATMSRRDVLKAVRSAGYSCSTERASSVQALLDPKEAVSEMARSMTGPDQTADRTGPGEDQ